MTLISIYSSFHSDNYAWEPRLHPYQQLGANVLFFTFINPATMDVPVAFKKLGLYLLARRRRRGVRCYFNIPRSGHAVQGHGGRHPL